MRVRLGLVAALTACLCACGSSQSKPVGPPKVTSFELNSKLLGFPLQEVLVTPAGGGKGRPLLVFLHGYGGTPIGTLSPAFLAALRKLGDREPNVLLPEGDVGWWHDHEGGRWGTYVMREAIPAALKRTGADSNSIAIGGISMGGFGALDLGRLDAKRFCAVGGHSPAVAEADSAEAALGFDGEADFKRHDVIGDARTHSPYDSPVWLDVGDHDALRPEVTRLANELKHDGADVTFHVWPGSHEGRYWDAHFADYLKFYADACG
jgi:predicted esterase